ICPPKAFEHPKTTGEYHGQERRPRSHRHYGQVARTVVGSTSGSLRVLAGHHPQADPLAKDRSGKKAVDFAHRYKWYGEVYPILHQVTYPIRHKIFGTRVNWTKWRENALYLLGFSLTLTVFVLLLMGFSHLGDSLGLPFKIEHEPVLIYEPDGIGGYDQYWSEETKTDWFFISIVVAVLVTGRFTQILLFDGKKFQWSEETEVAWWCWFWCFFTLALVEIAWLKLPRFPFDGLASLASLAICGFGFFKLYRYLLTKKE
ncbi:MAG: hypothetical protein ABGX31_04595, partial [bacterium]